MIVCEGSVYVVPLPPISSTARAFVLEFRFRFAHRPLVLFHFDPGAAGAVVGAPYRYQNRDQDAPTTHHEAYKKAVIDPKISMNVLT